MEACHSQWKHFLDVEFLVAKEGKVFYDKSFGYLAGDKKTPVDINTIYDIASITKVAATNLAVMKLVEQGKISLNEKVGYLPAHDQRHRQRIFENKRYSHAPSRLKVVDSFL